MFKFLTVTTLFASFAVFSLPLSAQGISQIDPQAWPADSSGVTRTIVGDTLLVECRPETVVPKRRPVAAKPRSGAKAGKVSHARRKVRKSPGATTIQVCKETRLPQKPAPKQTVVVAPPVEALGPIEGPQVASAAGMLPPSAPSVVVGGGHMFRGGAMAGVPLVFLAFLHHGNDYDNDADLVPGGPTVPTPPLTPPITTTPEPSSMALLACGLVGLGAVVRRRRR
jgi:hypothetical protein